MHGASPVVGALAVAGFDEYGAVAVADNSVQAVDCIRVDVVDGRHGVIANGIEAVGWLVAEARAMSPGSRDATDRGRSTPTA